MKFSIIVPHYDGVISDKVLCQGLDSLSQSTYKNFEVLIYHDGPVSRPFPNIEGYGLDYKFKETKKRYNDWGHSLRDLGIREATGDFIVHFNPDNILYDYALQQMVDTRDMYKEISIHDKLNLANTNKTHDDYKNCYDVIINPCILEGCLRFPNGSVFRTHDTEHHLIMDGFPVMPFNIDCMQLVASRKIWLEMNGWHDKSEVSDGKLLSAIYNKYGGIYTQKPMGIHR